MRRLKTDILQRISALAIVATMIFTLVDYSSLVSYAYEAQTGMICKEGGLTITRNKASDSGTKVSGLEYGKPVTVIDEVTSEGEVWYKVTYQLKKDNSTKTGYCKKSEVLLDKNATVTAYGKINGSNVFVRNDAGTSGTYKLVSLNQGHQVEILTQTLVSGELWYRVRCTSGGTTYIGWTYGQYITIGSYNVEPDVDFEQKMRNLGFPESYISSLNALHAKYPNWQFVPVLTGLDWSAAVKAESASGVNMVQTSADDARKSVASSEYNWSTNTWVIRDGTSWVTAHPDYIAYCMDPRNFLNETYIFMFESLSYSSVHNLAGVNAIIDGTFMDGGSTGVVKHSDGTSINYGETFMSVGKDLNVSPYHLASRVRQEQGSAGTSPLISGTYSGYTGYYNYYNVGAYGTPVSTLYKNGLTRAKNEGWNTRYKSIYGGAQTIAKNYISVGQDTLYFQKFNVVYTAKLYRHQYMANVTAAITEGKQTGTAYTNKNQAFVFEIPVYKNMPANPVSFTTTGSRNNYMKSISISGLSLTPSFSAATTSYSVVVGNGVSSITVSGTPVVSGSKVTGTGTYDLKVGTNTIKVNCKAQTGETRTYTINVVRQEYVAPGNTGSTGTSGGSTSGTTNSGTGSSGGTSTGSGSSTGTGSTSGGSSSGSTSTGNTGYSITSSKYNLGGQITGIAEGTTAADFVKNISCSGCTIKVYNASGKENTGKMATGNKVEVYANGQLVETKQVVIYGDVNGDGTITLLDMIQLKRHVLGISKLSGSYLTAADANRGNDGGTLLDMIVIKKHILGQGTIKQ